MAFHNIPPNGFPDIPDMEELEAVVKDVANLKTSVSGLSTDVSNLSDNKANQITIAPFFNPETAYEVGDLVYYNGLSYRCTNDHEGEWDADDFAATTVSNELATLKSGLTNLVKVYHANGTTDPVGDFTFSVPGNGTLIYVRPLRDDEYYNSWWGVVLASTGNNVGHSAKAIKDDNTALASQAIKYDVYYI